MPSPFIDAIPFSEELYKNPDSPIRHKITQARALELIQTEAELTPTQREIAKLIVSTDTHFAWHYIHLAGNALRTPWLKLHLDMYEDEVLKEQQKEKASEKMSDLVKRESLLTAAGKCYLLLMLENDELAKEYVRSGVPADERKRFVQHTVLEGVQLAQLAIHEKLFMDGA